MKLYFVLFFNVILFSQNKDWVDSPPTSDNSKYVGTLTDGDIRRGLLLNFTLKNKVKDVCNRKSYFVKKEIMKEGETIKDIFNTSQVFSSSI